MSFLNVSEMIETTFGSNCLSLEPILNSNTTYTHGWNVLCIIHCWLFHILQIYQISLHKIWKPELILIVGINHYNLGNSICVKSKHLLCTRDLNQQWPRKKQSVCVRNLNLAVIQIFNYYKCNFSIIPYFFNFISDHGLKVKCRML